MTLPAGTVTFLFTDLEGSTRLWERHGEAMRDLQTRHDDLVSRAVTGVGGHVVKTMGDGLMAVFEAAAGAVAATVEAQRAVLEAEWDPLPTPSIRMGLHTSEAVPVAGDYHGPAVNRAARIADAAHGGQILASGTTAGLVDGTGVIAALEFAPLGAHRLRDLTEAVELFQVTAPGLPASFDAPRTLDAADHNLPVQRSSFVGRETDISTILEMLDSHRLVTLTGLGGAGKTRLALQVAGEAALQRRDGVRLVELAPVTRADDVVPTIIDELRLPAPRDRRCDLLGRLTEHLQARDLLLLLDNCEHVLGETARLADRVLAQCPNVKVLATSREPLGLTGECVRPVAPLPVDEGERNDRGSPATPPAVRLFLERAATVRPELDRVGAHLDDVMRICQRVDGIPLAIELAAARTTHLSIVEIADRLDSHMGLLTSRERATAARHRTLNATLDWSHDLLAPEEQVLFRRLAAFSGGAPLDAVETVCGQGELDGVDVLDLVASLVDKSLLTCEESGGVTRYRMLETVRRYALTRLDEAAETVRVRRAHARWCADLAEQHVDAEGPGLASLLEHDRDDLLAALHWSLDAREADLALRLAGATWQWWEISGRLGEGRRILESALEIGDRNPDRYRSRVLAGAASLAFTAGDFGAARRLHEANLADLERLDARRELASTYNSLAMVTLFQGAPHEAATLAAESLERARGLGDEAAMAFARSSLGMVARAAGRGQEAAEHFLEALRLFRRTRRRTDAASVLNNLGNLAVDAGDTSRAHRFYEGALQLHREVGDDRGAALSLNNLSIVSQERANVDRAFEYAEEALQLFRRLGDRPGEAATLNNLANLADEQDDPQRAMDFYGRSIELFRQIGDGRGLATSLDNLGDVARRAGAPRLAWRCRIDAVMIHNRLGQADLATEGLEALMALAGLCALTDELARLGHLAGLDDPDGLEDALEMLRWTDLPERLADSDVDAPGTDLTDREQQVAALVGRGLSNREIAAELFISERTVDSHISHIRTKLDIDSRTKLTRWAVESGLVSAAP